MTLEADGVVDHTVRPVGKCQECGGFERLDDAGLVVPHSSVHRSNCSGSGAPPRIED